ncbi:MAG TPA: VWA domain-containing protein [Vicinamibacteria bacterium]
MPRRRKVEFFSLSFLDAICCGFGAVILIFMILNAVFGGTYRPRNDELRAEVDLLEEEVMEGQVSLVELRNSVEASDREAVLASGLSRRLIEALTEVREELATFEQSTLATREHVEKLKTDVKTLEDEVKRLSAAGPSDETPGDRLRSFVGDGDRQYLTGLKVGGRRILILVDRSASMLDDDIVNIVRRRNLSDAVKLRSAKWRQAVSTVDWITTQLPRDSKFQIYGFAAEAAPIVPGTDGQWLDAGSRDALDGAANQLKKVVPHGGTNLLQGFGVISRLSPPPDNVFLLVDGLPTMGRRVSGRTTISARDRLRLFEEATRGLPSRLPMNVILFPMEGDPAAPSEYWKLAVATGGAFVSPSKDWP